MQARKTAEIDSAVDEKNRPERISTGELLRLFGPAMEREEASGAGGENGEQEGVAGGTGGEDEPFIMVDDPYENQEDVVMGD